MPTYIYSARDAATGNPVQGKQDAENEYAAIRILQGRNLIISKIVPLGATGSVGDVSGHKKRKLHNRVKPADLLFFVRQTAVLLDAGVPLLRTLEVLASQVESLTLQEVLRVVIADIKAGLTFRGAIQKHPSIFPPIWGYLIEAGEAGGLLPLVLSQLAGYVEASISLRKKIVSALIYPSMIILVAIGAIIVFLVVLIPVFSRLFASFNAKLPPLTQALIDASDGLRHYGLYILAALGIAGYFLRNYLRTPDGIKKKDRFLLRLPIFSSLVKDSILVRIALNLSALIQSGVNLLQSLEISAKVSGNYIYENALRNVMHDIQQGKSLSAAISENGVFPSMVTHMIMIGEESGQLAPMIRKVADYYQERIDIFVGRLSVMIEPIIVLVVGGIVGLLVVAMFLPIISLSQVIH